MNVNESLEAALSGGLNALTLVQEVTFQSYLRTVLPLDGFVFWVPAQTITVKGAVHYATDRRQNEDETLDVHTVVFTAECEVQDFNQINTDTIFVASFNGIRFAFSRRSSYFTRAGLFHYVGDAVYPALASQLLDSGNNIDLSAAVVSNSLPLWLALNNYTPIYPTFGNSLMLYPSFAVPENLPPPYATIHIPPESTQARQSAPFLSRHTTHHQLAVEHVRVTLYGLQNDAALDFMDCVEQYTVDTGNFGIMNMPIVRDGKRPQSELMALAMQKFIDFEIDYFQTRVNDVARQLIETAIPTFIFSSKID